VLTWHVHGNYLWYLTRAPHDFYVPVKAGRPHPYGGRSGSFPWSDNLHEIAADEVRRRPFDCVLLQSRRNAFHDQCELLSPAQRNVPRVYLEHDPPLEHPFAQRHPVNDPDVIVVHVTPWNALMWDCGRAPTHVVEHGVFVPGGVRATYELPRGITAVNHLRSRGRRMGADVFCRMRARVPIDLVGMDAEALGGIGEIDPPSLARVQSRYRFHFSPVRQTSLSLAVIEAMMIGLPVVGLATCELASVIENDESGFVSTSLPALGDAMRRLIRDPAEAARLGAGARRTAIERFGIERFAHDWDVLLTDVAGRGRPRVSTPRRTPPLAEVTA
jgi:hypothetical protein